ncbi:MAG: hypothetical protein OEY94_07005 [Alphaproteobacteria bacterium]|nr:hypothetical protein [Alphaproteobacteria bacterium]
MVDPVNGTLQIHQISGADKKSAKESDEKHKSSENKEVDQVNISDEAISIAEASEAARQASQALKDNDTLNLSADTKRLNQLV